MAIPFEDAGFYMLHDGETIQGELYFKAATEHITVRLSPRACAEAISKGLGDVSAPNFYTVMHAAATYVVERVKEGYDYSNEAIFKTNGCEFLLSFYANDAHIDITIDNEEWVSACLSGKRVDLFNPNIDLGSFETAIQGDVGGTITMHFRTGRTYLCGEVVEIRDVDNVLVATVELKEDVNFTEWALKVAETTECEKDKHLTLVPIAKVIGLLVKQKRAEHVQKVLTKVVRCVQGRHIPIMVES